MGKLLRTEIGCASTETGGDHHSCMHRVRHRNKPRADTKYPTPHADYMDTYKGVYACAHTRVYLYTRIPRYRFGRVQG